MKRLTVIFGIVLCIVLLNPMSINAQSGADVAFSPVTEYLTIDPGGSHSGDVKVTNFGNNYMTYEVDILPFTSIPENPGVPRQMSAEQAATYPYNASPWFAFSVDEFSLDPLGVKEFQYNIKVPYSARPGGYYAGIFFRDISSKDEGDVGATLVGGPIFLIKVSGDLVESIEVIEFKTKKDFYEYPPVDFITTIENTGNVHIVPRGDIEITNMFGDKVATMNFNEEKYNILRESTSIFENRWDRGSNILKKLFSDDKKILFGKMEAKLVVLYRSENPGYDYKTLYTTFWIIPWKILLVILLLLFLIILYIRKKIKSKGTRKYAD